MISGYLGDGTEFTICFATSQNACDLFSILQKYRADKPAEPAADNACLVCGIPRPLGTAAELEQLARLRDRRPDPAHTRAKLGTGYGCRLCINGEPHTHDGDPV